MKLSPKRLSLIAVTAGGLLLIIGLTVRANHLKRTRSTPTPLALVSPSASPSPSPTPTAVPTLTPTPMPKPAATSKPATSLSFIRMIKDVGEPQYDHFGLVDSDFQKLKDAGFNVIGVNFDICSGDEDVKYLLNTAQKYGLKIFMPAGSGEAEWGYVCDAEIPVDQKPVWQKDKVQAWVKKWKNYPAVYGWDSSNEDGENMPNGSNNPQIKQTWVDKFAVSTQDLQTAYRDIKAIDSNHPIMIRMNGFWFYEHDSDFFQPGNHFGPGVADIVMVNAYSNIFDPYEPKFVSDTIKKAIPAIHGIEPKAKIMVSLAAWKELPDWNMPSTNNIESDYKQVVAFNPNISGVAYFKFGTTEGNDWYLPDDKRGNNSIWNKLIDLNKRT